MATAGFRRRGRLVDTTSVLLEARERVPSLELLILKPAADHRPQVAAAVDWARGEAPDAPVLAMTPRGAPLTQARVRALAAGPGVTILCGRFEGIDERLFDGRPIETVSIGDYILSGGEMAALARHLGFVTTSDPDDRTQVLHTLTL